MKALVVSDTHGIVIPLISILREKREFDMFFFLGDYVGDGETIGKSLNLETHIVSGNGDFGSSYPTEKIVQVMDKRILLTHGHKQRVKYGIQNLYYFSREKEVDITLFGHNHMASYEKIDDLYIINPGSPFHPRGYDGLGSYGILTIEGNVDYKTVYIR